MSKALIRFLSAIISTAAAVVIGYFAYLAVDVNNSKIQTVNVSSVTADVGFSVDAMIFREEDLVLKERGQSCYVIAETGEKVGGGESFAICFDSGEELDAYLELMELQNKLSLIDSALAAEDEGDTLKSLNSEACAITRELSSVSGQGGIIKSDMGDRLLQCLLSRNVCIGEDASVLALSSSVLADISDIEHEISGGEYLTAEHSGYFSGLADGWEQVITLDRLLAFSFDEYRAAVSAGALSIDTDRVVGKMIYGYTWYLSFCTDAQTGEDIAVGEELDIILAGEEYSLEVYSKHLSSDESEVLVILECHVPLSDISLEREQKVTVIRVSYEGFRVPSEAIRVEDGVTGVYVLEGTQAVFKPIEVLYSEDGYYLVTGNDEDRSQLFINDAVIIGGKGLYDGKVVD